jgi:hypothetical protein
MRIETITEYGELVDNQINAAIEILKSSNPDSLAVEEAIEALNGYKARSARALHLMLSKAVIAAAESETDYLKRTYKEMGLFLGGKK